MFNQYADSLVSCQPYITQQAASPECGQDATSSASPQMRLLIGRTRLLALAYLQYKE
ncbi:hypothetical protein ACJEMS_07445 [Escherichia coli]